MLVTVVRTNGNPVGPSDLMLQWESLDLPALYCGIGDMGFGVSGDGTPTELPCQEGVWTISVWGWPGPDQELSIYGQGQVIVGGDQTVELTIRLDTEPPPPGL